MLLHTLLIVAPVFILIGIGYGLAKFKVLKQPVSEALGQFVYVVAIPLLIFRTLISADFSGGFPLALWGSYFMGAFSAWTLGTLIIRKGFGREARAGAIGGISAAFANLVLVGIPLISAVYGEAGLAPLMLVISVHLATMTVVMAVAMERAAAVDNGEPAPPLGKLVAGAAKGLYTNPIVLTIISAFIWRQTGFALPALASDIVDRIAATAMPLALLSLGMSLVQYGMRGNLLPGFLLSVIKIFIMPAIVFLTGTYLFPLPPLWLTVVTVMAACPTGVNAYIFANRYGTGHAMSANAITLTTLSAIVTTSFWILLLNGWLGIGPSVP